ncbi:Alpha/beta hydrolase family protein [Aquisphaera giovannonii]|uniref:Alpha/beta hydrolase family protein n=1 Tax=Aquisphaera giovannonii TaxID=406548 RepID=A0A5B9W950_9BACT|nr:alpha/beta hydrolase-fold protein [Aquisphaera giovannonii]QEH37138.1 Alpha/beta hydrolase family protein [Aquisphaera giovannonii]
MRGSFTAGRGMAILAAFVACVSAQLGPVAPADTVYLKNGIVYRSQGAPDRDNTLVFLWDGLKKTVIRDSRIDHIIGDNAFRTGEKFTLVQPLSVHGGSMPKNVTSVQAGPWNERGRRDFRYQVSPTSRPVAMEQAIIEIGPHVTRYRAVDNFWLGQVATSQVPREVITGLLGKVEQANQAERERVVRFFMDAGWYPEAKTELDRLVKEFPKTDLAERAAGAKTFMLQAEATQRRSDFEARRRAQQYRKASALLKSFTDKAIPTELVLEVRELIRQDDDQRAADQAMASDLSRLEAKLPAVDRGTWRKRTIEATRALGQAPDAVRERFNAWRKSKAVPGTTDANQFALAMSGYVAGSDAASPDLNAADALWKARDLIRDYLNAPDAAAREGISARLEELAWPAGENVPDGYRRLELATKIAQLMPPPLHDPSAEPDKVIAHKLEAGEEEEPTEYSIVLPPEYHPLRAYPALVVLHSGDGPKKGLDAWSAEATRRGYIVIAPEYGTSGEGAEYHYSPSEHAAVEIALRDARKRYAIDSDRVFVAGQLQGGTMAWDLALGHPDLFAGAAVISGFPAKYVLRSLGQHDRLPLYYAVGDLAPAANEIVFGNYLKPLILKAWDVTYCEYTRRALEELPEEIPFVLDWTDRHRRDPYPKTFDAASARTCDSRFFGVVVRDFSPGRTTAPEAVEVLGQNLSPATIKYRTSSVGNLVNVRVSGVNRLDVWVSPRLIDFKKKLEVRVNDKPRVKGMVKLDLEPFLEDLRIRGDRQQVYWLKVTAG